MIIVPSAPLGAGSGPRARGNAAVSTRRRFRVKLDPAQYFNDMMTPTSTGSGGGGDWYGRVNLLVRRKAKENNFKAVLDSVRDLLNAPEGPQRAVPPWMVDVLLGYGSPASAHYRYHNPSLPFRFLVTPLDFCIHCVHVYVFVSVR